MVVVVVVVCVCVCGWWGVGCEELEIFFLFIVRGSCVTRMTREEYIYELRKYQVG